MRIKSLVFLIAILCSTTVGAKDISDKCYSVREKIFDGNRSLGYYEATARLKKQPNSILISFLVSMPDSGQVLESEKNIATEPKPNTYIFHFTDGWENKGKGSLAISGNRAILNLQEEKIAEGGNNILRNYGEHHLKKTSCK